MTDDGPISGDTVPVIQCKKCGQARRVAAIPADDQRRPYAKFRYKCPLCGADQKVRLSDIRPGKVHRKH